MRKHNIAGLVVEDGKLRVSTARVVGQQYNDEDGRLVLEFSESIEDALVRAWFADSAVYGADLHILETKNGLVTKAAVTFR